MKWIYKINNPDMKYKIWKHIFQFSQSGKIFLETGQNMIIYYLFSRHSRSVEFTLMIDFFLVENFLFVTSEENIFEQRWIFLRNEKKENNNPRVYFSIFFIFNLQYFHEITSMYGKFNDNVNTLHSYTHLKS